MFKKSFKEHSFYKTHTAHCSCCEVNDANTRQNETCKPCASFYSLDDLQKMIQFQEYKHIFQKSFVMQIEKGVNIWYHDDVAPD